jgi:iron complex transport system ATP-binding protein
MNRPSLQVQGLCAAYGHKPVLHQVSLSVTAGEVLAVIGPNGCGKSTLLRCIAGLISPTEGKLSWAEAPLPSVPRERAKRIALLPQVFTGGDELTVEEMAMLGRTPYLGPYGSPSARDREAVEAALQLTIPDLRGRRLGELSGGERQRALLGRVLASEAPILLLDEPVSALDIHYQHEILHLVRRLSRERQLAVVVVLHGINLAASVADGMLLLRRGEAIAFGPPEAVMTEAHLTSVYGLPLRIAPHPLSGRPQAQAMWDFNL